MRDNNLLTDEDTPTDVDTAAEIIPSSNQPKTHVKRGAATKALRKMKEWTGGSR